MAEERHLSVKFLAYITNLRVTWRDLLRGHHSQVITKPRSTLSKLRLEYSQYLQYSIVGNSIILSENNRSTSQLQIVFYLMG